VEKRTGSQWQNIDKSAFDQSIRYSGTPALMPGLVADWSATKAACQSMAVLANYLKRLDRGQAVGTMLSPPKVGGRFFYDDEMRGFNFQQREIAFVQVVDKLVEVSADVHPIAIYAGSAGAARLVPDFAIENPMPLLDAAIEPRLWLGNQSRVAAHYDVADNIACVVSGKRRFTLFAPEQVANLYIGPLDFNMAGQPASLVDFANPDFERFPRFHEALAAAHVFDLEPGDALFIPALWWHHVEAFGPFNLLVNYWWQGAGDGPAFESMILGLLGIRDRSPAEREAWRSFFEHYVFGEDAANSADHIPAHARGVLGPPSDERKQKMMSFVMARLSQR
jgi:hypothetical protein